MNDFANLDKIIVRELSCRLCLCTDVVKLKPLSAEVKRKIKKLFDIAVRTDDNLPKAICHECLQQVSAMHLYAVKVDKTQKYLSFHKTKTHEEDKFPVKVTSSAHNMSQPQSDKKQTVTNGNTNAVAPRKPPATTPDQAPEHIHQQGDTKLKPIVKYTPPKKKSPAEMKFLEAMPMEEFAQSEKVDKALLSNTNVTERPTAAKPIAADPTSKKNIEKSRSDDHLNDTLDPVVLIDGRPARQGTALDKQISLFYKMECCICHERGFQYRTLMKHYKDRHGVPGYVTCCDKKFHYFYPKKIIEHMAYHLQPNIFMCPSCHQNFQTSLELLEHQSNGGRSEGKILCPRCTERYPTYRELGWHIITHRTDNRSQCDYCAKLLKHHHRKKTINQMEDVKLCSQCVRTLRSIEKQEKEKEKVKANDITTVQKYQKFKQALGLSDEEASTE